MTSNLLALLEFLLVFGLVIGFGVWQLASLRRDRRRSETEREREP